MITGDQKAETAAIAELAITIKADSPELGEKVDQLQKQDKIFRDLQTQQVLLLECLSVIFFCDSELFCTKNFFYSFSRPASLRSLSQERLQSSNTLTRLTLNLHYMVLL